MDRLMTRWLMLLLMTATLAGFGCDDGAPASQTKPTAKKNKKVTRPPPKHLDIQPVEVKADEFAGVEAALVELERVLEISSDDERNRGEIRVQNWLAMQQDKAVPLVAARAGDPDESLPMRITTCRILGKLGPAAAAPLIALTAKDEPLQLRVKATETLGLMQPSQTATAALVALLDDREPKVQLEAIKALTKIGPPAKSAAGKLSELRQRHADEGIRVAAGEALKKVDPRKALIE